MNPASGQVWADDNLYTGEGLLWIERIDGGLAVTRPVALVDHGVVLLNRVRRTRIRLSRLRTPNSGYRYVGEA